MKKIIKLQSIGIILFSMLFTMSCSDDNNSPSTSVLNIEEAKLLDFPLFAIEPTGIEIVQPEIVDNKEVTYGEIKITLPSTITSLENISASITSKELNLSKFSISPSNSVNLSFEDGKVHVFTISAATGDQEALLHYNVSIIKEVAPVPETLKITGFTFEKSKNPSLPNDITITKTVEDDGGIDKIYLFVPLGTDFTDLVPTIAYDGTTLYYTQENNLNTNVEFPTVDTSFDLKYPKPLYLTVKDRNGDNVRTTNVIVDVVNPVRIETVSVTSPDATEGTSEYFPGVTKWVNQGNHKINFQKATIYKDISPVITPTTNVITVDRALPSGGLIPGESANVNVRVSQYFPEGTYKTTAVFYTRIYHDFDSDDLFEPVEVTVTANIIK
ncbi:hypothetical protein Q4Q35_03350 [Flavivirga aquimarina]|uniref:DUF5018 domain-containing protein n=1 Tax=Flavivirga aquimarina TaxID=2027862 RepID=A0ABT8W6Y7_9FLAO|nr:hypothetical protein [Flavivirga aquimarina]MDO5968832.1 hypothetical protein [Flavivirga aquimarina]